VLAVLSTFLISLLLGASLAWGKPAALAAYLLNIWFIVSLSLQGGAAQALPQALAWLIGTILAAALATVLLVSLHNQYLIVFIIMVFAFLACFLQDSFSRGFLVSMTGFAYAHRNREKSKN